MCTNQTCQTGQHVVPPFQACMYHTPDSNHDTKKREWVRPASLPFSSNERPPYQFCSGRMRRVFNEINTSPCQRLRSPPRLPIVHPRHYCQRTTRLYPVRPPRYSYKSRLAKPVSPYAPLFKNAYTMLSITTMIPKKGNVYVLPP